MGFENSGETTTPPPYSDPVGCTGMVRSTLVPRPSPNNASRSRLRSPAPALAATRRASPLPRSPEAPRPSPDPRPGGPITPAPASPLPGSQPDRPVPGDRRLGRPRPQRLVSSFPLILSSLLSLLASFPQIHNPNFPLYVNLLASYR